VFFLEHLFLIALFFLEHLFLIALFIFHKLNKHFFKCLSHFLCTNILFIVRHLSYLFKVLNVYSFNYFVFIYVCLSIHSFYLLHSCINLFNCSCINLFIWSCIIYLKYPHTCLFNCIAYLIFILCHSYCCTLFSSTPSLCFFFLSINGLFGINLNKTFFIINKG
jgi:hypothetical protein